MKNISKIAIAVLISFSAFSIAAPAMAHTVKKNCKYVWKNGKKVLVCTKKKHSHIVPVPKPISQLPPMSPPPYHGMPPAQPPKPMPKTTCHAEDLQYLIGRNRTDLMTIRFAMPVRIEEPGMMYTMEYSAERLRIIINEKGIISKLMCG